MPTKEKETILTIKSFETEEVYLQWLNEVPRIEKENPDGSKYVPISCVQEDLFSGFLGNTRFELLRENVFNNGLSGVGRLHYKHPLTGEWLFQDGSAAIPFNGGLRLDFPSLSGHIMLSCAKKIGVRFGQMLNRDKDDAPVKDAGIITEEPLTDELKTYKKQLDKIKSVEELQPLRPLPSQRSKRVLFLARTKELQKS